MAGKYPPLGSLKQLADENAAALKKAYELEKENEPYLSKEEFETFKEEFETFKVFPTQEFDADYLKQKVLAAMGLPKDVLIIDPITVPDPALQKSAGELFEKLKKITEGLKLTILKPTQPTQLPKHLHKAAQLGAAYGMGSEKLQEMLGVFPDKNPCGEVALEKPKPSIGPEDKVHFGIDFGHKNDFSEMFILGSDKPVPLAQNKEKDVALSKQAQKNTKKAKNKKQKNAEAIFQWQMDSGKEIAGVRARYYTQLRSDGSVTCNCPGWVFKKKGETTRFCKHTTQVEEEAKSIFKKWKSGATLPSFDIETSTSVPTTKPAAIPVLKYGRVLDT